MNRLARLGPGVPVLGLLLALTAIVRAVNLNGSPARIDDEGTYVAQAFAITQWGELAHYTYWYDHPPFGWMQLALWSLVVGPSTAGNAVASARLLMVAVAVVIAALIWLLARRVGMTRWSSALAVGLFALSPLSVTLGRTVYLDNLAVAWVLGAAVLLCSPKRQLAAVFGAATCFGVAVLSKETMLLFAPMFAWLVWTRSVPATRRYALAVFGAVFGVMLTTYLLMATVRGELVPGPGHVSLWEGVKFQLWGRDAGGGLGDAYSLKRHTIDQWLMFDPVVTLLAAPVAAAGLLVDRLRPFAIGLMVVVVMVIRPGYLPVPLVISAIPLVAVIGAGLIEVAVHALLEWGIASSALRWLRGPALGAAALAVSITLALWWPTYRGLTGADDDAPMRMAQEWIAANVPRSDRLIVDDALWVDLVRDGRDRRNVVWAYKLDTDTQVQSLAPAGWRDYDWVISTSSMRANVPAHGVLADAVEHSRPAARFGSGGLRVELLRIDKNATETRTVSPAAPGYGDVLAARLAGSASPDALGILQSPTVDQRVVAALAVLAAAEPVVLEDIPAVDGEYGVGTPRRELVVSVPGSRQRALAAFFGSQTGAFATESVAMRNDALIIRFPLRTKQIGLAVPAPSADGGPASIRVSDLRHGRTGRQEWLNLVRIDGTAAGSVPIVAGAAPSSYRSVPPGVYVVTTNAIGHAPTIRQVLSVESGTSYTLALFSGPDGSEMAAQLAPDSAAAPAPGAGTVRLIEAADGAGPADVWMTALDTGTRTTLATNVGYGLVTGYAALPAGIYSATVRAKGREWSQQIRVNDGQATTLLLMDGPAGPLLHPLVDGATEAPPLDPSALSLPDHADPVVMPASASAVSDSGGSARVALASAFLAVIGALAFAGGIALRRRRRS